MYINHKRPVEELVGPNYGIVRQILGRVHVGRSNLAAAREAYGSIKGKGRTRNYPVALRRGLAKCILETHAGNRGLYVAVMSGNL